MCGIFGFTSLNEATRLMLPVLAIKMNERGRDSWGCTDGEGIFKSVGNIIDGHKQIYNTWDNIDGIIFHTRGASPGSSITVENAHPHRFFKILESTDDYIKTRIVTGIHNGYLANHQELKNKYHEDRKNFDVDTKHIFKHIIEDMDTKEIKGVGAIVWFDTIAITYRKDPDNPKIISNVMNMAKFNSDNLYVCKLKQNKGFVFASTREAIESAAKLAGVEIETFFKTEENKRYAFGFDDDDANLVNMKLMCYGDLEFGKREVASSHSNFRHHAAGYVAAGNSRKAERKENHDKCPSCDTTIDPTTEALCSECYSLWLEGRFSLLRGAV